MEYGGNRKKLEDEFNLDNLYKDLHKLEKQIIMSPNSENHPSLDNNWSMVVIKDNDEDSSLVFPPTHHENLHLNKPPSISTEELQKYPHSSSSRCSSPSSSQSSSPSSIISVENADDSSSSAIIPLSATGGDDDKDSTMNGFIDRLSFGFEALIGKVKRLILNPSFFTSVVLLGFVYFQQKRLNFHRQRRTIMLEESREKDLVIILTVRIFFRFCPSSVC